MSRSRIIKFVLLATVVVFAGWVQTGCVVGSRLLNLMTNLSPFSDHAPDECFADRTIVISIPGNGGLFLGRDQVNSSVELKVLLRQRLSRIWDDQKAVYIKAAVSAELGEVAEVAGIVKSLGATPVFVTPKKVRA